MQPVEEEPLDTLPSRRELERELRRGRQKRMAVEVAMVAALLRRRRGVVEANIRLPARAVEAQLAMALADEIGRYRNVARSRSREALGRELSAMGMRRDIGRAQREVSGRSHDAGAAEAARWREQAERQPKGPYRTAAQQSSPDVPSPSDYRRAARQDGGIHRIATTETSDAWSAERRAAAAMVPPGWIEVWDATLDKITCPECSFADGDKTQPGHDFPNGLRPPVHPNCRCSTYFTPRAAND